MLTFLGTYSVQCQIHLDHPVQGVGRAHIRGDCPKPTHFVNVTRLYFPSLCLFAVADLEKGPCPQREVHSAAEFRIKMSRLLLLAAMVLLVAILAVEPVECGSIRNRYVTIGKNRRRLSESFQ